MSIWVLQVSDLHFGHSSTHLAATVALTATTAAVQRVLSETPGSLVVALCGDVVDKGDPSYFDVAARSIDLHLIQALGRPPVVCCPGNHDVVSGENGHFSAFNRFAFRLTNNPDLMFDRTRTVTSTVLSGYEFVLVNSMFEGYKTYKVGMVDIDALGRLLGANMASPRVVITHHSLIPSNPADTSSIGNAYPMLRAVTTGGVSAVLHGHMHSETVLTVGARATALVGVGSLLFKPYPNYNNSFNLLRFEGGRLTRALAFRYIADSVQGGTTSTFERTELAVE